MNSRSSTSVPALLPGIALLALALAAAGCSSTHTYYGGPKQARIEKTLPSKCVVTLTDKSQVHVVNALARGDSLLGVRYVARDTSGGGPDSVAVPYSVAFADVAKIHARRPNRFGTTLIIGGIAAFMLGSIAY